MFLGVSLLLWVNKQHVSLFSMFFLCIKNTHVGQSVRLSKCAMKHHQENEVY